MLIEFHYITLTQFHYINGIPLLYQTFIMLLELIIIIHKYQLSHNYSNLEQI